MFKQFEIRENKEKTLTKLVKSFNDIVTRNGQKPIVPVKLFNKDIECKVINHCPGGKDIEYTVPGAVYTIDIPDDIISINGHSPIGK